MFYLNVFLMSCDCYCSIALPHGAGVVLQCVIEANSDHTHFN